MSEVAIEVSNLSKVFNLYPSAKSMFREFLLGGKHHEEKTALSDVTFTVNKGDIMGVAGPNGAGKSTLLKIISGVMPPTSGSVKVHGKVTSILELGTGFRPDYTGRQNVIMGGLYLGYRKQDIEDRMDWIIKFSELKEAIDWPFGTYSSGMKARLMFSLAVSADPDIFIVDEALAVGDSAFATKCFQRINQICMDGATVFFVTHQMSYLTRSCNRAMFIDGGEVKAMSDPGSIAQMYEKLMLSRSPESSMAPFDFDAHSKDGGIAILRSMAIEGLDSQSNLTVGGNIRFSMNLEFEQDFNEVFAFVQIIRSITGETISSLHNRHALDLSYKARPTTVNFKKGRNVIHISLPYLNVASGKYAVNFGLAEADNNYSYDDMILYARNCGRFSVTRPDLWQNVMLELPSEWSVESD